MGDSEAAKTVVQAVEAPAPQPPAPSFGFAEIEKLFAHLRAALKSDTFHHDDALQYAAVVHLWRAWSMLDAELRERAWRVFDGRVPRVSQATEPRTCFYQLMALPSEEDIRRALLVRAAGYESFVPEPGDGLYPTQGWIGKYLAFARHNQVPLPFHFWAAVTALGAACRRNVYCERGISRLYMNQYVILTGEPATGKSVAMETSIDILRRVNRQLGDSPEATPFHINILPEDITQEAFIAKMESINKDSWHKDPRTGLVERRFTDATAILPLDELMNFLGKGNFAIQKRIPFLVTIYAKDAHEKETKGGGRESLRNLAVSMLACSAPTWMREQVTQDIFGGGFMDRTMFIFREKTRRCYPEPPPMDPLQAEALAEALVPLTTMPFKQCAQLDYSAKKWHEDWYRAEFERAAGETDPEAKTLNRRANHALKLGTLLAVSYGSFPRVSKDHLEEAMMLLDAEDKYFGQFLEHVHRHPKADYFDYILRVMVRNGGAMQRGALLQKIKWKLGPANEAWHYVETLLKDGSLVEDPGRRPGKWLALPGALSTEK